MRYLKGYCLLLMASLAACSKSSTSTTYLGNWVKKRPQYRGVARSNAASFVIGNKAYVGTGYDGNDRLKDFWAYDVDQNMWTNVAPFDGPARSGAVGMAIGTKGYIGTGYDGVNKLNDFYEYNPDANAWTRKADFGGTPRYGAVAFGLKDFGYIATGYDGNWQVDNWEYNPATNSWTQAQAMISGKRQDASAFVIGNKAYVCMGTANSTFITDFYVFDGDTKSWATLNSIDNVSDSSFDDSYNFKGSGAASFAIGGKGYIVSGTKGSLSSAVWEYNPQDDRWTQKTDFEGAARTGATGFNVKDRGFVVLGVSNNQPFDDMLEFYPNAEYNKND
jgi:N-acetylneuraminic acid mutarotase